MEAKKRCSLICTISILVLLVIVSIILCAYFGNRNASKLEFEPKCGEFQEVEYAPRGLQQIPFADELEHYFDAYKRNDTDEMAKTLDSLKSIQTDDADMFEIVARNGVKTLVCKFNHIILIGK